MGLASIKSAARRLPPVLLVFALSPFTTSCEDHYRDFYVLLITPDRVWFKVDHQAVSKSGFTAARTLASTIYVWEKPDRLEKVFHFKGSDYSYPFHFGLVNISPQGDRFWARRPDGTLFTWDLATREQTTISDRVHAWCGRVSADGQHYWFLRTWDPRGTRLPPEPGVERRDRPLGDGSEEIVPFLGRQRVLPARALVAQGATS